ncbi:hypothetical protein JP75_08265 [Devosia riboflavina]|uniref:2-dehydro-3-deoxygalactonokinase n=1 Tax=Devosia riboflavina TaxID=46914 RepID=A0A087M3R0_9HYPH|nr:2-dehydro-3-deoxygalactonokinase [Devosia riboflavina]KFL31513.1 hypothetical protein JP75_08265 [Devosia riboflavina]
MLIGVEWTSQAFEASLIDESGTVLADLKKGMGTTAVRDRRFAETFLELVPEVWRNEASATYFSGMITGRGGWVETGFVETPASLGDLAKTAVARSEGVLPLLFLPGIASIGALPDVMRGEEIRVFAAASDHASATVILPGLHTKYVSVEAGRIMRLGTYMGGETAKLLSRDSLISRLIPADAVVTDAGFGRGLAAAWEDALPGGPLRRLFSARSLVLFDRMPAEDIAGYIAGLMAGAEIAEAEAEWSLRTGPVLVLGESPEAKHYLAALNQRGIPALSKQASAAFSFAALHRALSRPAQFA